MTALFIPFWLLLSVFCLLAAPVAQAQETSGGFGGGSVAIGWDNRACSGSLEGAVRYNTTNACVEFCDGTDWACAGVGVGDVICSAPPLCPNVGDVCDDGNGGNNPDPVFAGFMLYDLTCTALYAGSADASTASKWKTSDGTDDIDPDSTEDGQINDASIPNSTTFPVFKDCKDFADGGYSDWYLPARDELNLLFKNRTAIGGFSGDYWSSSEESINFAFGQFFTGASAGKQYYDSKSTYSDHVRCVRRD